MDFKVGQTIELIKMEDDPNPIAAGTRGKITGINVTPFDGETQIQVAWENGRTLMMIHPQDEFRRVYCEGQIDYLRSKSYVSGHELKDCIAGHTTPDVLLNAEDFEEFEKL